MARIAGVDLPRDKKVEVGLTYIFGIGRSVAHKIVTTTGINANQRIRDLSDADVNLLRQAIERDYRVEGALRTEVAMNIKRLMDIGSYRAKSTSTKKSKRVVESEGIAHVSATFNNTTIPITHMRGKAVSWSS